MTYRIEYRCPDYDYPTWEDYAEWVEGGVPTFATQAEAQAWLDARLDADLARRQALADAHEQKVAPRRELFRRRKALLEEAGLWKQEGESFVPIMGVAGWQGDLNRHDEDYRIVAVTGGSASEPNSATAANEAGDVA